MNDTQPSTVSLRCNHCGAPLEVAAGARYLTCSYCSAQLEVHHSGGAVYTEVLGEIDERTERIERDVQEIKRQNALEQLDREWDQRRQQLMVASKNGSKHVPSMAGGVASGVIAVVVGIGWIAFTAGAGAPGFVSLIGLVVIAAGVIGAGVQIAKADQYASEERAYRARRETAGRGNDPPG